MPSEKFFVHKEDGSLVRLKGRLVRFLDEEPPTGSDKSAIRTALEVSPDAEGLVQADIGTGPQNLVLHQHLGTMAYADADGVSAGTISADEIGVGTSDPNYEIEVKASNARIAATSDGGVVNHLQSNSTTGFVGTHTNHPLALKTNGTERVRIDSSGRVGIGNTSPIGPLTVQVAADKNLVTSTQYSGASLEAVNDAYSANIPLAIYGSPIRLLSGNVEVNSGNIVMGSSYGIDFGSAATSAGQGTGTTGSVSNSVLSDYEYGSWTPTFAPSGGSFASITMDVQSATYVKVGRMVHCQAYIRTDGLDTTGASGSVRVTGLPFVNSGSSNYAAVSVGLSRNWVTNPAGGYVNNGVASLTLTKRTTSSTELIEMEPADMTTGSGTDKNAVLMSFQYIAST